MTEPPARTTRVAAYGLLVEEGRLLLCRLSEGVRGHHGRWTLPGGGIEFGETPADAMVREVEEETGLLVRPAGVADVVSLHLEHEDGEFHGIRIVYFTEILGGTLRSEVDGTTDLAAWHSFEAARALPLVGLAETGLALAASGAGEGGGR